MYQARWDPTGSGTASAQGAHGPQVEFHIGVSITKLLHYENNKHVTDQEKRGQTLVYYVTHLKGCLQHWRSGATAIADFQYLSCWVQPTYDCCLQEQHYSYHTAGIMPVALPPMR